MSKVQKKIGILPNSVDFSHPQDRRRYVPFLSRFGCEYDTAIFDNSYDILYMSLSCDLNMWANYRKKNPNTRIIFDLSDNYLTAGAFQSFIRSVGHYISGRTKTLMFDYRASIQNILDIADIICVGSVEQKSFIENRTSGKIIITRDSFEEFDKPRVIKCNCDVKSGEVNICWEGFPHSIIPTIRFIKEFLNEIAESMGVVINIYFITDRKSCKYFGKYMCEELDVILNREFRSNRKINAFLLDWSIENMLFATMKCDFSIIPVSDDKFARSKPENKLLLYWYLGLPVITSNIPSYSRLADQFGLSKFCCSSINDWISAAKCLICKPEEYIKSSDKIYLYINDNLLTDSIDRNMREVFGI
jgi:hypothetical protein